MMDAKCKISKTPTIWPCAARWCPLYHDCQREYEKMVQNSYTNSDRIRDMDDKEMAKFLCDFRSCDADDHPCDGCKAELFCHTGHSGMIDWLQQPAPNEGEQNV